MKTESEIKSRRDILLSYIDNSGVDESIIMSSQQKARINAKVSILNWVLDNKSTQSLKSKVMPCTDLSDLRGRIKDVLKDGTHSCRDIAQIVGYGIRYVGFELRQMKKFGEVEMIGPSKKATWALSSRRESKQ